MSTQTEKKQAFELVKLANQRSRLEHALKTTLTVLGVDEKQAKAIVSDVKLANFESLNKTMKIEGS